MDLLLMGITHPVSSVALARESNAVFQAGVASVQGLREEMEDYHAMALSKGGSAPSFFGVYDGHGGTRSAAFCSDVLHKFIIKDMSNDAAIIKNCLAADTELRKVMPRTSQSGEGGKPEQAETSGTTAVFCTVSLLPEDAPSSSIEQIQKDFFVSKKKQSIRPNTPHSGAGALGLDAHPFKGQEDAPPVPPDDEPPPPAPEEDAPPPPPEEDAAPPPSSDDTPPLSLTDNSNSSSSASVFVFDTDKKEWRGPRRRVVVGNVGDSRCVLGHEGTGEALALSKDHKPNQKKEARRIKNAGGEVKTQKEGPARVDGMIAVCRAFGDFAFKNNQKLPADEQKLIAVPDLKVVETNDSRHFLFLGCDGVFDVMSNQEVVAFIAAALRKQRKSGEVDPAAIMKDLTAHCIQKETKDNVTAMLVLFQSGPEVSSDEFIPGTIPDDITEEDDEPWFTAYSGFAKRYGWTLQECRNWLATGKRDVTAPSAPTPPEGDRDEDDDDIILSGINPLLNA
eukprot:gb/GEZN01005118.1/.p1 GENE.gb/GEZN01005118.1/~~gb/GEZN01005118.1/.p1  ORF type:complete len:507 (-),score=112.69 gb/GEZN01005118.1/:189-1709(-)